MNREQLEEIRARALAASKGPWATPVYDEDERAGFILNGQVGMEEHAVACVAPAWSRRSAEANATFISHARADVPALLDEIDRLNAVAWKLRTVMIQQHEAGSHFLWIDDCPACVKARDECDGDYSCDQQKAWQKEYEEALSLPLAAPSTAESGTSKGPEVS